MKTSKFENTLRRKLESIEPDFQEKDWAKMQKYMHAQQPPTFWQQHRSWIGYAAAASVSTVMAFLYVSQRTQNNHLTADVKKLQHQIAAIHNSPAAANKPDTVYLLQKNDGSQELVAVAKEQTGNHLAKDSGNDLFVAKDQPSDQMASANAKLPAISNSALLAKSNADHGGSGFGNAPSDIQSAFGAAPLARFSLPAEIQLENKHATSLKNSSLEINKMQYALANRISKRQYQKALLAANLPTSATVSSDKTADQVAQTENVIPKLDLKVPYRFGVGYQTDQIGKTKSIIGEVLVAKKFSISAGISWLKVKPMEFLTEKLFREKNRKEFRGEHPEGVPLAFPVYNIKVNPTLVQIPLTVAFRNNIKDNWAYYAGAGTNITVSAREKISFDSKTPGNEYSSQSFERKSGVPLVNSVNFMMGLEKTWYPVVVQAEGYLYTYFNQLTPTSHQAGPGVKVKLMYQIGGKM